MEVITCNKCGNSIPLVDGLNYRVMRTEKTVFEVSIELHIVLGVYCAVCGQEELFHYRYYFDKTFFENVDENTLISKALSNLKYFRVRGGVTCGTF